MRAEMDSLNPGEEAMPSGASRGGALSVEMLVATIAPMRAAMDRLPKLIEELTKTVKENQAAMLEKMERVAVAMEAAQRAMEDVRDDIDHVANEVAIRNADYIRERQERGEG